MKPYFERGGIKIFHGDCREILPTLDKGAFDLVLTDPPYGMSYESNRYIGKNPFGAIKGDGEYPVDVLKDLIAKYSRVGVLAFCRWENLKDLPKPKSFLVWVKNSHTMGDLDHEYARQWEGICFWNGPDHKWAKGRPQDIIRCDRVPPQALQHPTEKPVELLGILLSQHECETVLDPYCGSGSTLEAAKLLGLKATGIELEERYCEIAARRLEQEVFDFTEAK